MQMAVIVCGYIVRHVCLCGRPFFRMEQISSYFLTDFHEI
jgi:hypothetical protein